MATERFTLKGEAILMSNGEFVRYVDFLELANAHEAGLALQYDLQQELNAATKQLKRMRKMIDEVIPPADPTSQTVQQIKDLAAKLP